MNNSIPLVKIKDIIEIKRENARINTINKSCHVISVRLSGESLFFYDNNKILAQKGDILYIPNGATYKQESKEERLICIHLDGYFFKTDKIMLFKTECADYICRLFSKCYSLWQKKEDKYQYKCMSVMYEILSYMDGKVQSCNESPILDEALKYLDSKIFDVDFTISSLCKNIGVSRTYFNMLFKEKLQCMPKEYIGKRRLEKAKFLLKSGGYTNEDISYLCGFGDVKYFYVFFKKMTGLTTKQFIKSVLTDENDAHILI